MDKVSWPEFLATKIQSLIALENAEKARTWFLGFISLAALGFSFHMIGGGSNNRLYLYNSKLMFLMLFHAVMVLGVYFPGLLQKGARPFAKFVGIRDFTSLMLISVMLAFYVIVALMLSHQVVADLKEMHLSNFFTVAAWLNEFLAVAYFAGFLFFFLGFSFFPHLLTKVSNVSGKATYVLAGLHAVLFFFLGFGYAETVLIGSPVFFEQFFVTVLFWLFIGSSVVFVGRFLKESALPILAALELEVVSGRLEKSDEILERYKKVFVLARLTAWLSRLSQRTNARAKEIAQYAHDAVGLVNRDKPTEIDLRQVEDRYKKAESASKKLERENQRFQLSVSWMDLSSVELEKVEALRDLFSRECRNAKLELASIRKRIDEKLVAIKNTMPLPVPEPSVLETSSAR